MKTESGISNPRQGMERAIEVMEGSIQEPREDGVISPEVGAVLVMPDGTHETACRGQLRDGEHAEDTLIERMLSKTLLDEAMLFVTLEPCAPGARTPPKRSCSEIIVSARIPKVWIGIEDPDPKVDRKGIQFLIDSGVEVEMFEPDLQDKIRQCNKDFIRQAEERAKAITKIAVPTLSSSLDEPIDGTSYDDLSAEALQNFSEVASINLDSSAERFKMILAQLGLLYRQEDDFIPTGNGLLLFGKRTQLSLPHALVRAIYRKDGIEVTMPAFEGNLARQAKEALEWFKTNIGGRYDRSGSQRQMVYDYPEIVIREALTNAIVHRDYSIEGAPIIFEVNDDAIIIKSPGFPVEPITFEQIGSLKAPTLSRNPKIMYVFNQLQLSEQRGLGLETIRKLPSEFGLPLPLVTYDAPYLIFTFPRGDTVPSEILAGKGIDLLTGVPDNLRLGFDYIRTNESVSRKEYAAFFNLPDRTASRELKGLEEVGLIEKVGKGPATIYKALV